MNALKKLDAHIWEREAHEHYVEPEWCSRRLFEEMDFDAPNTTIWDPCCGFGRIPEAARMAGYCSMATDKVHRGYSGTTTVVDFFAADIRGCDIVCNPPFDIAPGFANHALKLCRRYVAMIFPTARLNAAHWLKETPLQTVWLLTPRPSMPPGHVIAAGQKPGGGKMDFCWLVWERNYSGNPELKWLRRDK